MIDDDLRKAIFRLKAKGRGSRRIARALAISRTTVLKALKRRSSERPVLVRPRSLDPHLGEIKRLYGLCEGSLSRVHEELEAVIRQSVPYSTLTQYCRDQGLGDPQEKQPAGEYIFGPGVEMQHDTSPILVTVGGIERLYQAASLKFCFCRVRYLRFYRQFRRFHCKDFLVRALEFVDCVCSRCMIDNSSVIIAHGTGPQAVPAPEMEAFAKWFDFKFEAHEVGDANRSAKVERDFDFIQRNFFKGRTFTDDADLNQKAEEWCRRKNGRYNSKLRLCPQKLLEEERAHAHRAPEWHRPVYLLHVRRVDASGFVNLDGNEYSAPNAVLGREVTVRETMDSVTLLDGHQELCVHPRLPEGTRGRSRLEGHGRVPRRRTSPGKVQPEEVWLTSQGDDLARYVDGLRRRAGRSYSHQIRKLYGLCQDYDLDKVQGAAQRAAHYDLYDTNRLEGMLLQELGATLFGFRPRRASDDLRGCVTPTLPAPTAVPSDTPVATDEADEEDPISMECNSDAAA